MSSSLSLSLSLSLSFFLSFSCSVLQGEQLACLCVASMNGHRDKEGEKISHRKNDLHFLAGFIFDETSKPATRPWLTVHVTSTTGSHTHIFHRVIDGTNQSIFESPMLHESAVSFLSIHSYAYFDGERNESPVHFDCLDVHLDMCPLYPLQVALCLSLVLRQLYPDFRCCLFCMCLYSGGPGWMQCPVLGACGDCSSCSFFQLINLPAFWHPPFCLLCVGV